MYVSAWLCSSGQNRAPSARPAPAELPARGWRKDGVKRGCRCQKHREGSERLAPEVSPSLGREPALPRSRTPAASCIYCKEQLEKNDPFPPPAHIKAK